MTPAEFELACEQVEVAYERDEITASEFRKRMESLGFGEDHINEWLSDLNRLKADHPHD